MSEIKIEKGIPLTFPGRRRGTCIYPFAEMEVGDSFAVPNDKYKSVQTTSRYQGILIRRTFSVRKHDGGYRCWRIK